MTLIRFLIAEHKCCLARYDPTDNVSIADSSDAHELHGHMASNDCGAGFWRSDEYWQNEVASLAFHKASRQSRRLARQVTTQAGLQSRQRSCAAHDKKQVQEFFPGCSDTGWQMLQVISTALQ